MILKVIDDDVTITVKRVNNNTLSTVAKSYVGDRPMFELTVVGDNSKKVTDFGKDRVSGLTKFARIHLTTIGGEMNCKKMQLSL